MLFAKLSVTLVASLACVSSAFLNTSPLVIISNQRQIKDAEALVGSSAEESIGYSVESVLSKFQSNLGCHYDAYILASQPGVSDDDISQETTPELMKLVSKAAAVLQFPSLLSEASNTKDSGMDQLASIIKQQCNAQLISTDSESKDFSPYVDTTPRVISVNLKKSQGLTANDKYLHDIIGHLPTGNFLVVYGDTTGEESEAVHSDSYSAKNETFVSPNASLFARYQFFSPGIFMSTIIPLLLIYILYTALGWISSLKISYVSFEPKK